MSNLDSATSSLLLSGLAEGFDQNEVSDLYKVVKDYPGEGPTKEQVEGVNNLLGKRVKVKYSSHIGVVTSLNESTHGFYPGGRYPAYVKIVESDMDVAIGQTFEYGLEFLEEIKQ